MASDGYEQLKDVRNRLNYYYQCVQSVILTRQNACTGLIPASVAVTTHGDYRDAWVRDNVYSIYAVFGLALAYRRLDDDSGRAYELEHAVIKCMRGLLFCMMRQAHKVEQFKLTQNVEHCLHAKYNTSTGSTVVGDKDWGHLQLDATSFFVLALAEMTAADFHIIHTLDEVDFVQNLVFYIERAYRTPDYGIWERGNKLNHGMPELNSSSIGMALAALEAINGLNLFGARGGPSSVIHVLPDELTRNWTTLHSALPRESYSKEVDAAVLSVIGFPAFAVADAALYERTKAEIRKKLGGIYGCKRFLRDGHQTAVEDTSRLHYDAHELKIFENIESEWPLFFTYFILDGLFTDNRDQVEEYRALLQPLLVDSSNLNVFRQAHRDSNVSVADSDHNPESGQQTELAQSHRRGSLSLSRSVSPGMFFPFGNEETGMADAPEPPSEMRLIPELYVVPPESIEAEKQNPHSQKRIPNENIPLVWAQSLYILGNLVYENLLSPAEIDPLGRRYNIAHNRNRTDPVVQVVLVSENASLQSRLSMLGLETQTVEQCMPVVVAAPSALRDAYRRLGANAKLGISGRPKRPIGTLSTCKLYRCMGQLIAFTPHFLDREEFYLVSDNEYLLSVFEQELVFVKRHWHGKGRPTMVVVLTNQMLGHVPKSKAQKSGGRARSTPYSGGSSRSLLNFMISLRTGLCAGVRVRLGRISELISTSCIESLDFLLAPCKGDVSLLINYFKYSHKSLATKNKLHIAAKMGQSERHRAVRHLDASLSTVPHRTAALNVSTESVNGLNATGGGSRSPLTSPLLDEDGSENCSENFKLKDHEDDICHQSTNVFENSFNQSINNAVLAEGDLARSKSLNGNNEALEVLTKTGASLSVSNNNSIANSSGRGLASNRMSIAFKEDSLPTTPRDHHRRKKSYGFMDGPASSNSQFGDEGSIAESFGTGDLLTLTLHDPSHVQDAISLLRTSVNLFDQADLLHYMHSCHGPDFIIHELGQVSVTELLEEVYIKSMQHKLWSIVRQVAGLLRKTVNSLTINVTDLLIRQKPVTVGFGNLEHTFMSPMSPQLLADIIYSHCNSDIREAPLVQEVLTYLGSFIRSQPNMFSGIMRVRVHFFIIAMREEISRLRKCNEEKAVEHLMQLCPFAIKSLLGQVLTACEQTAQIPASISPVMPESGVKLQLSSDRHLSGHKVPESFSIAAQSGGYQAGNFAVLELKRDGIPVHTSIVFGRGLNVLVIDPTEGRVIETGVFDTHISAEDSDELAKLIEWLEPSTVVVAIVKDDAYEHLTEAAKSALETLGSASIRLLGYRDSFCLIGEKGAPRGSVPEALSKANAGPTSTISLELQLRNQALWKPDNRANSSSGFVVNSIVGPSQGRWLRRRKNDGALSRVPTDFYPKVWRILSGCQALKIHKAFLPRDPTVSEKTPEEFNFALQVESILDIIRDPAERQIAVELLMVISKIQNRNPELRIGNQVIDLGAIIRDAIQRFWEKWASEVGANVASAYLASLNSPSQNVSLSESVTTSQSAKTAGTPSLNIVVNAANGHGDAVAESDALLKSTSDSLSSLNSVISTTGFQDNDMTFERNERIARRLFFDLPQEGPSGTISYLAGACARQFSQYNIDTDPNVCLTM